MIWPAVLAVLAVVLVVARLVGVRRATDALGNQTVAVAFAPPRATTPGLSAALRREVPASTIVPAEILDLAVRGVWQVGVQGEGAEKVWFVQRDDTTEPDLPEVSLAVYRAVFPPGSRATRVDLSPDRERTAAFQAAASEAYAGVQRRGWVEYGVPQRLLMTGWAGMGVAVLAFLTLLGGTTPAGLPLLGVAVVGGLATQFIRPKPWRLTPEGRRINDELDGLKLYMTMAEADRLKVLQAPDTAQRVPALAGADGENKGEIAKLHERLLPYAVLFGILPQWSEVVKHSYEDAEYAPGWLALDVATDIMLWSMFLDMGGLDALGGLGDFGADLGDASGMDALDAGGDLGGGDIGGDGGGFFGGDGGGGDGGGFDFDFDF